MEPGPRSIDLRYDASRTSRSLQHELGVDLEVVRDPIVVAGRYEVEERVGSGAYGTVYRARDRQLPRRVALKVVARSGYGEALSLARVQHPHLLRLYDYGVADDYGFLVLEHLDGVSLDAWLASRPTRAEVLARFRELALGLAALHAAGFVHRDIKPSNVMVVEGRAVVVDFGLAVALGEQTTTCGTLRYMAPEQLLEQAVDARADQFSFCVALWEALAGRDPFRKSSPAGRLERIIEGPVGLAPGPARVARALRRGLEVTAERRHVSMQALADACAPRSPTAPLLAAAVAVVVALAVAGRDRDETGLDEQEQLVELARAAASGRDWDGAVRALELAVHRSRQREGLGVLGLQSRAAHAAGRELARARQRALALDAIALAEHMIAAGELRSSLDVLSLAAEMYIDAGDLSEARALEARIARGR